MSNTAIRALALAALLSAGSAQAFVIDGNLADWGINHEGKESDWTPHITDPNIRVVKHTVEDQHPSNGFLYPGYGGQAYDAEAIYVALSADTLYIAIATGHDPRTTDNPSGNRYAAGDIAIDFGNDFSFEYGIELLGGSSTARGRVYSNVHWAYGIWKSEGTWTGYRNPDDARNLVLADRLHPTSIRSGRDIGAATVANTTAGQTGYGVYTADPHYFYEVSVPLSVFSADDRNQAFTVHWTQNCANDSILVDPPSGGPASVPEPATLALLPLGMIGIAALRRKKPAG